MIHDHNIDGSKRRVTFNLEAGKITPVWHKLAKDTIWVIFVKTYNFDIYLLDGRVVPVRNQSDLPELGGKAFKIAATSDPAIVAFEIYPYTKEKMEELNNESQ